MCKYSTTVWNVDYILAGMFANRIRSVSFEAIQDLQKVLYSRELSNDEVDNVARFFDSIPADLTMVFLRASNKFNTKTLCQLLKRGIYRSFINRMRM